MVALLRDVLKRLRSHTPPVGSPPGATAAASAPSSLAASAAPGTPGPDGVVVDQGAPLFNGTPVPTYPDKGKAIPAATPEVLLASQDGLIKQLRQAIGIAPERFDRYVLPVLVRYAAFVHLLPASESHHHSGQGGLLRHSLEVAFYAARFTEGMVFAMDHEPSVRKHLELRYRLAIIFGGLLHDAGKVLMDIGVVDPTGAKQWNPHENSLHEWLVQHRLPGYYLFWKAGSRFKRHEPFAVMVMHRILGPETVAFMSEHGGTEVLERLGLALSGTQDPHNPIVHVVTRCDATSVEDDLRETRDRLSAVAAGGLQNPAIRILEVMRRLVREGIWKVNQPGAMIWSTDQGVFVSHPDVIRQTVETMVRQGERGIPNDPMEVLKLFLQSGFLTLYKSPNGNENVTWQVVIALPAGAQMLTYTHSLIRFERPDLLYGTLPVPEPISVAIAGTTVPPSVGVAPPSAEENNATPTPPASTPSESPRAPVSPNSTVPPMAQEAVVEERRPRADRKQYVEGRRDSSRDVDSAAAANAILDENQREGTYLRFAIDLAKQGTQVQWGRDIVLVEDRVLLSHDVAFQDSGAEPAKIMNYFHALRWLESRPSAPDRLVVPYKDSEGIDRKGICFNARMSSVILLFTNPSDHPPQAASVSQASSAESVVNTGEETAGLAEVPGAAKAARRAATTAPTFMETKVASAATASSSETSRKRGGAQSSFDMAATEEINDGGMKEHEYFKVVLLYVMERVFPNVKGGIHHLDEPGIFRCLNDVAKRTGVDLMWLKQLVLRAPNALLNHRKPGDARTRLTINPKFDRHALRAPNGFWERYPQLERIES